MFWDSIKYYGRVKDYFLLTCWHLTYLW